MKFTKQILFCCLISSFSLITAAEEDPVVTKCAAKHGITESDLLALRATEEKEKFPATDELKCFTKCTAEEYTFVKDKKIDVETVVKVFVAKGKDEKIVRENIEKCLPLFKEDFDCNVAWELYVCFSKF